MTNPLDLDVRHDAKTLALRHAQLGVVFEARLQAGQQARAAGQALEIVAPGGMTVYGTARLGKHARALRLAVPKRSQVVQTGIGHPDSGLNDSLYDPDSDTALQFEARNVAVTREMEADFRITLRGDRVVRVALKENHLGSFCPYLGNGRIEVKGTAPCGWLSYYCHFEHPTERTILEDLDAAGELTDYGFSFFLIEMWQKNANKPRVWTYHHEAEADRGKFHHGMKWMAKQIRRRGLRPGLWVVPFGTGNPAVYDAHWDMFLNDAQGRPLSDWSGIFMLDPTHPAAQRHMCRQLRILAEDWGYEFFKLDGLSGRPDHYCEWFYAQPEVRARFSRKIAEPLRTCLKKLRRTLGRSRYFHACAADYRGACVGVPDGARVGQDVFFSGESGSWKSIRHAASVLLGSLFTHRYIWHADPDILSLRAPLSIDQARAWATIFGLTGAFLASSDRLARLPKKRLDILKRVLPPADILPMDLTPCAKRMPIWKLGVRKPFARWSVVALFNWDGSGETTRRIRFHELGLDGRATYLLFDFWNQTFLGEHKKETLLTLPHQACRVIAIHEKADVPQVISTNRHITQGAVSIHKLAWYQERRVLRGRCEVVADDPYDLFIHVPKGLRAKRWESDADSSRLARMTGEILRLRLQHGTTGLRDWTVRFQEA